MKDDCHFPCLTIPILFLTFPLTSSNRSAGTRPAWRSGTCRLSPNGMSLAPSCFPTCSRAKSSAPRYSNRISRTPCLSTERRIRLMTKQSQIAERKPVGEQGPGDHGQEAAEQKSSRDIPKRSKFSSALPSPSLHPFVRWNHFSGRSFGRAPPHSTIRDVCTQNIRR